MASGQIAQGNIDLYNRPHVKNADGSVSTVRSMSFEDNGREVLIPTADWDRTQGDHGRILSDEEAIQRYRQTGKHLGIFTDPQAATAYAKKLHEDYAAGKYERKPSDYSGAVK